MEMRIRKLYHSIFLKDENDKDYRLSFSVGDVVRFVNRGYVYDYYENAIKFFNVNPNSKNLGKDAFGRLILPYKEEFLQQNFVIMDAAIHENFLDTVVYLVANKDYSAIVNYRQSKDWQLLDSTIKNEFLRTFSQFHPLSPQA